MVVVEKFTKEALFFYSFLELDVSSLGSGSESVRLDG